MLRIAIAGGTGLVGSRLIHHHLPADQYEVTILTRKAKSTHGHIRYAEWDLDSQTIDPKALDVDAIINLTGAGIADARWTAARKQVIIESRTQSAALLKTGLAQLDRRPRVYIGASAIGYYGDAGDQVLEESASPGSGFLSQSCMAWEDAHHLLSDTVDRQVLLRIGIVLAKDGGALPKMMMTHKARLYTYFGDGQQYYSWIHIDDLCRMILHAIHHTDVNGVYNAVSHPPLPNKEMMAQIGKAITGQHVLLPAPAFGLKLAMGEMSAIILDSARVDNKMIRSTGFEFTYTDVGAAVKALYA